MRAGNVIPPEPPCVVVFGSIDIALLRIRSTQIQLSATAAHLILGTHSTDDLLQPIIRDVYRLMFASLQSRRVRALYTEAYDSHDHTL